MWACLPLITSSQHAMTSLALSLQAQTLRLQISLARRPSSAPSLGRPTPSTCSLSSSHWMRGSALQRRGEGHSQPPRARGALRVQALFEKFTVSVGGSWGGRGPVAAPSDRGHDWRRRCLLTPAPCPRVQLPPAPLLPLAPAGAQHQVGHACAGGGTADERNRGAGRGAHPAALWAPALASGQTWQTLSVRPHHCPAGPPAGLHGAHIAGADCRGLRQGRLPGLWPHGGWHPSLALHSCPHAAGGRRGLPALLKHWPGSAPPLALSSPLELGTQFACRHCPIAPCADREGAARGGHCDWAGAPRCAQGPALQVGASAVHWCIMQRCLCDAQAVPCWEAVHVSRNGSCSPLALACNPAAQFDFCPPALHPAAARLRRCLRRRSWSRAACPCLSSRACMQASMGRTMQYFGHYFSHLSCCKTAGSMTGCVHPAPHKSELLPGCHVVPCHGYAFKFLGGMHRVPWPPFARPDCRPEHIFLAVLSTGDATSRKLFEW